ncbi:MAG: DUF6350 family protein [Actinomycetes bacterium]
MTGPPIARPRRLLDVVRPPRDDAPDTTSIVLHAGGAGALAAVVGLAFALVVTECTWLLAPHGDTASFTAPLRVGAGVWLVAHHVTLDLPQGPIAISPLGFMVIPLGLAYLAGRQAARALRMGTLGDVGRALVVLALAYGLVCAVVAGLVRSEAMRPHTWQAFVAGLLVAGVGGGLGLLKGAGLSSTLRDRLPQRGRTCLAAGAGALGTLLGLSAIVLAVQLAVGFPEALQIARTVRADALGGVLLALLGVAFVPNLVVWTGSFLAGPGFVVGSQTQVSVQGVDYGALPLFAPLAALPPEGRPGPVALLALVVPLAAGAVCGVLVHRRSRDERPEAAAATAAGSGLLCGLGFVVLAWLSGGSVGTGRLAEVGPSWTTGLVVGLEIGLTAAVVTWELHRRRAPHSITLP